MSSVGTDLDANQVLKNIYDDVNNRIRVDSSVTASIGDLSVDISHTDDSVAVYGTDGTSNRQLKTDVDGNLQVDVLSSALPTGAASAALQTSGNTTLSTLNSKFITDMVYASGNITSPLSYIELDVNGYGAVVAHVGIGQVVLGGAVSFEASVDGATFVPISGCSLTTFNGDLSTAALEPGLFTFNVAGFSKFRLTGAVVPDVPVAMRATKGTAVINQLQADTYVKASGGALSTTQADNDRIKVLNASDLTETYTYADFGTADERITSIVYNSPGLGLSATKTISYVLDTLKYRMTTVVWS